MAGVDKNGRMEQSTKASGKTTKPKVKENSPTQTETVTKATGQTTKPTDMEPTPTIRQVPNMRGTGKMTCNTGQVWRSTAMEINMKGCSNKAKETAKGPTTMLLDRSIRVDGSTEESKGMEYANGPMAKNIKDSGKTIKSMDKASTLGLMAENMRVTIETTRNTAMALILGQMVDNTSDSGKTTKDTAMVPM